MSRYERRRMKPLVFNYRKYEDLREAYRELLADNSKLAADNRRLRKKLANAEIKLRILEESDD